MKLISRGFALAVMVTVVVGCAAGRADSPTPGSAGATAGGSGAAGSVGSAGSAGSVGAGGAGGCVMPPVVKVSWMIMTGRDLSSPKLTCAQAGVKYVEFFMDTAHTQFNCDDQAGMSTDFKSGMYTPRVLLTNSQNTIVFQGTGPNPVSVPTCGVANIGNFSFVVSPTGTGGAGGTGGAAGGGGTAGVSGSGGAGGAGGSTGAAGVGGGTGPCNALPIFAIHSCASPGACHDANGTSANFNMASPNWEKNLVGKLPKAGGAAGFASACVGSGMPYLVAGSVPARGLFLDKLASAKPACGLQMPLLPSYLSATELDCVQRWANALTKP